MRRRQLTRQDSHSHEEGDPAPKKAKVSSGPVKWVQCDLCNEWRILPPGSKMPNRGEDWIVLGDLYTVEGRRKGRPSSPRLELGRAAEEGRIASSTVEAARPLLLVERRGVWLLCAALSYCAGVRVSTADTALWVSKAL